MYEEAREASDLLSMWLAEMNEAWEEFEQLTWARFSRLTLSSRLETSSVTVMEMEPALAMLIRVVSEMVSMILSSPTT
jgi:hypothetical protein